MKQSRGQTADRQTLGNLVNEAIGARQMLPPYERCLELNRGLRAAIGDLYVRVQEDLGRQPRHSREWNRVRKVLDDADDALAGDLGSGLLSAAIQLGALARTADALEAETR